MSFWWGSGKGGATGLRPALGEFGSGYREGMCKGQEQMSQLVPGPHWLESEK